ncbi:MAG: tRNA (N6-isopentenyl adenosine(37)-C2)-methylthiotransferase MiaB [Candidatus Eiseniibacteriota bacterium]|jgi:tRNA-2-methylthio-N6-dimethylallyladenosine synthase
MPTRIPILSTPHPAAPAPDAAPATSARQPVPLDRRVFIETYGCQMNVADTELMHGLLRDAGFGRAGSVDDADVVLVNTCAIREHAEQRVWNRLEQLSHLKRRRPDLVLGVTGCMAKHVGERLTAATAAVDVLAGPDAYRRLPALIAAVTGGTQLALGMDRGEDYLGIDPLRDGGVSGWVTIMRGCDRFCSFCVVPYVRGRERSVPAGEVLRQVRDLARSGYREVTLLGQTVNAYRHDGVTFADLLDRVSRVERLARIRFTSPHPADFDDACLEVLASRPNVMRHIHLPVQSGADRVLARMRRDYTRAEFLALVDRMRAAVPGITFTTDLIAGFPGETRQEFEATLDLVRQVEFESAFMFLYSERQGTTAARDHADDVPHAEKVARLQELIELQEAISARRNRLWVGRTVEVLVEGPSRRDASRLHGRTEQAKSVILPAGRAAAGDLVPVHIAASTSHTLFAAGVSPAARAAAG